MATITPASPSRKQIAKVTSKGQITIPAEVRESMGVKAGDKLIFERSADGEMFIKKAEQFPFDKFRGIGTGIPELEANPESIINYIRELRGHDEFDHID